MDVFRFFPPLWFFAPAGGLFACAMTGLVPEMQVTIMAAGLFFMNLGLTVALLLKR